MTTPQAAPAPHETYATRFSFRPVALGRRGMVATANPLATLAGLQMFARGGNAVDALVAAAAAIGVAEPYMSGLAGCGVLVLTRPGHRPQVLNFLGRAPSGTSRERMHGANHTSGPLSVAVPGNLAGWARVLADHGTLLARRRARARRRAGRGRTPADAVRPPDVRRAPHPPGRGDRPELSPRRPHAGRRRAGRPAESRRHVPAHRPRGHPGRLRRGARRRES